MPETAPPVKRRGAIDTLVVRDHTAIFWFLVAITTAAGCTWYVSLMAEAFALQSSFVVMDTAGAYYVPPGVPYSDKKMDTMHYQLADMAVETVLDRTREGLTFGDRVPKLFQKAAQGKLRVYLEKEGTYFRDQNVTQTFEIHQTEITYKGITTVTTKTTGLMNRVSYLAGQRQDRSYDFSIIIAWRANRDLLKDQNFPSLVEVMDITEFQKSEETTPTPEGAPKSDAQ